MSTDYHTLGDADAIRAELYHCASMHGTYEQQRSVIEALERLVDAGTIDDVRRRAWAHVLTPMADDEWCQRAREAYDRFSEWASQNDRTLEPGFDVRTVTSMAEATSYDVVKFPVLCVAVYADGDLVRVAPSRDPVEEEAYTIEDCLEELGVRPATDVAREPATASY